MSDGVDHLIQDFPHRHLADLLQIGHGLVPSSPFVTFVTSLSGHTSPTEYIV
jgi:hypothetical protein